MQVHHTLSRSPSAGEIPASLVRLSFIVIFPCCELKQTALPTPQKEVLSCGRAYIPLLLPLLFFLSGMSTNSANMRSKSIRPAPSEIEFKNMRFLITDRPTDATMQSYIEVRIFIFVFLTVCDLFDKFSLCSTNAYCIYQKK